MRFLVPIIVLIVTFIVVPREGQEQPAETAIVHEKAVVTTDDVTKYDESIESPGVLSRLTLLDL